MALSMKMSCHVMFECVAGTIRKPCGIEYDVQKLIFYKPGYCTKGYSKTVVLNEPNNRYPRSFCGSYLCKQVL